MKKTLSIFAIVALAFAACACNGLEPEKKESTGSLILCIAPDLSATKAASSTAAETYEKQVNSMEVYLFDDRGNITKKFALSDFTASSGTYAKSVDVPTGTYTVWAVANKTLNAATKSDLEAKTVALGENSLTASTGFILAGSNTVSVSASGASVSVAMSRFVGRVRLVSVTNEAGSAVSVSGAFLENVAANQNIAGTAAISTWNNLAGRDGGSGAVVSSSTADNPALTFASGNTWPHNFYGFANSTSPDQKGNGSTTTITAAKTRIVVFGTYNGAATYYPVTIADFERNKSYDISLVITGKGSDDPNVEPEKGSVSISITVADWVSGQDAATYTI